MAIQLKQGPFVGQPIRKDERTCKAGLLQVNWGSSPYMRERHNLNHKKEGLPIKACDVMLIQSDERNRGKWKLGIVVKLIKGRDGFVRAARLRAGKSYLERAIQQLCPMELSCDRIQEPQAPVLNPTAQESGRGCYRTHKGYCWSRTTTELEVNIKEKIILVCFVFDNSGIKKRESVVTASLRYA